MNAPFLDGIKYGFLLAIMLGPIFFALIQAGVERGFRSGAMVGLGIWISDALFILAVIFGIHILQAITNWPGFELTFGIVGAIILVLAGIGTVAKRPAPIAVEAAERNKKIEAKTYLGLWVKGFLINTINPFTFFFWIGMAGIVVAGERYDTTGVYAFFTGIFFTIVVTDILKVLLAKSIRKSLQYKHVVWLRKISGVALVVFGVMLLLRVLVF